jgi:hypothetical protein
MAPETIIGQIRPTLTEKFHADKKDRLSADKKNKTAEDITGPVLWEGLFGTLEYTAVMNRERGTILTVDWERGGSDEASAAEIWRMIFDSNQPWMLSANGTIFTYEFEGVIPGLLTRWYSERKQVQAKLKEAKTKEEQDFLDKRQLVRKILLNSAYGALLNQHCRFFDFRIGQSTTLSGRQIVKHMSGHLNQNITGKYDHTGEAIVYGDTDSVAEDSIIQTSVGEMDIESLFLSGTTFWKEGDKEYSRNDDISIAHPTDNCSGINFVNYNYVYRHKVSKGRYKITTQDGNSVVVTEDHSIMVKDGDCLVEKKPSEIAVGDCVISIM